MEGRGREEVTKILAVVIGANLLLLAMIASRGMEWRLAGGACIGLASLAGYYIGANGPPAAH